MVLLYGISDFGSFRRLVTGLCYWGLELGCVAGVGIKTLILCLEMFLKDHEIFKVNKSWDFLFIGFQSRLLLLLIVLNCISKNLLYGSLLKIEEFLGRIRFYI